GVRLLGALGFDNAYALAMPRQRAEALGIASIADLAAHAPQLAIAGDYEFFERPEWKTLQSAYGLTFRRQRTMQSDFMYQAAANGEVDVVSAYTSDGRVAQYGLKVLSDPKGAIPPYDAVLLIAPKRTGDAKLIDALRPLIGAIDVTTMREANLRASAGDVTADAVAQWLWGEIKKKEKSAAFAMSPLPLWERVPERRRSRARAGEGSAPKASPEASRGTRSLSLRARHPLPQGERARENAALPYSSSLSYRPAPAA